HRQLGRERVLGTVDDCCSRRNLCRVGVECPGRRLRCRSCGNHLWHKSIGCRLWWCHGLSCRRTQRRCHTGCRWLVACNRWCSRVCEWLLRSRTKEGCYHLLPALGGCKKRRNRIYCRESV